MAMEKRILNVEGMTCSHCENRVKKSLGKIDGVGSVRVDLEGKMVEVDFDAESVDLDTIKEMIEDQGYNVG